MEGMAHDSVSDEEDLATIRRDWKQQAISYGEEDNEDDQMEPEVEGVKTLTDSHEIEAPGAAS